MRANFGPGLPVHLLRHGRKILCFQAWIATRWGVSCLPPPFVAFFLGFGGVNDTRGDLHFVVLWGDFLACSLLGSGRCSGGAAKILVFSALAFPPACLVRGDPFFVPLLQVSRIRNFGLACLACALSVQWPTSPHYRPTAKRGFILQISFLLYTRIYYGAMATATESVFEGKSSTALS